MDMEYPELDFCSMIQPVSDRSILGMQGYYLWGSSMVRTEDGTCHLIFSRWPEELEMKGWFTHSQLAYAVSDDPAGPYSFESVALSGAGTGWDSDWIHSSQLNRFGSKYYLYYVGARVGEERGVFYTRRIGVAVADHPSGPWERFEQPIVDVTPGAWDQYTTANPSCVKGPDGRYFLYYKGVGSNPRRKENPISRYYGLAVSDSPTGPFVKYRIRGLGDPVHEVEDGTFWCMDGRFYCILRDFSGYWAGTEGAALAYFESDDGIEWRLCAHPLAKRLKIKKENGSVQKVARLERPYLWIEDGIPRVLFCSCLPHWDDRKNSVNVHFPLLPA